VCYRVVWFTDPRFPLIHAFVLVSGVPHACFSFSLPLAIPLAMPFSNILRCTAIHLLTRQRNVLSSCLLYLSEFFRNLFRVSCHLSSQRGGALVFSSFSFLRDLVSNTSASLPLRRQSSIRPAMTFHRLLRLSRIFLLLLLLLLLLPILFLAPLLHHPHLLHLLQALPLLPLVVDPVDVVAFRPLPTSSTLTHSAAVAGGGVLYPILYRSLCKICGS